MGKFIFGVCLLAALLVLCLGISGQFSVCAPIAETLEQAAQESLAGNLEEGLFLAREAYSAWQENWRITAALSDHGHIDDIDGLFAQLKAYGQAGLKEDFAALCQNAAKLISAIGNTQKPSWHNIF